MARASHRPACRSHAQGPSLAPPSSPPCPPPRASGPEPSAPRRAPLTPPSPGRASLYGSAGGAAGGPPPSPPAQLPSVRRPQPARRSHRPECRSPAGSGAPGGDGGAGPHPRGRRSAAGGVSHPLGPGGGSPSRPRAANRASRCPRPPAIAPRHAQLLLWGPPPPPLTPLLFCPSGPHWRWTGLVTSRPPPAGGVQVEDPHRPPSPDRCRAGTAGSQCQGLAVPEPDAAQANQRLRGGPRRWRFGSGQPRPEPRAAPRTRHPPATPARKMAPSPQSGAQTGAQTPRHRPPPARISFPAPPTNPANQGHEARGGNCEPPRPFPFPWPRPGSPSPGTQGPNGGQLDPEAAWSCGRAPAACGPQAGQAYAVPRFRGTGFRGFRESKIGVFRIPVHRPSFRDGEVHAVPAVPAVPAVHVHAMFSSWSHVQLVLRWRCLLSRSRVRSCATRRRGSPPQAGRMRSSRESSSFSLCHGIFFRRSAPGGLSLSHLREGREEEGGGES